MQVQEFNDLPLSKDVLRGIKALGFEKPSPIQAQSIMPLLEGRDVIGQAQTGTGKTAAFAIPMVESVDLSDDRVQGLVLAPTRELAIQIADHISRISRYTGVRVCPIYGGEKINRQIRQLKRGVHIVVGTPGRIIDHLERRTLRLKAVHMVVLDEADRMLDMGFVQDINKILGKVPEHKQTSLFSATMDRNVWRICDKYMDRPEKILVSKDEIAVETIDQRYMLIAGHEKFDTLTRLIEYMDIDRALIFCRRRTTVDRLTGMLKRERFDAEAIHGQLSQARREQVLRDFREAKLTFMVATEVAARGLDIVDVPFIINYDIPDDPFMYFHRIGRTARAGKSGTAVTFVTYEEDFELERIEALTGTRIKKMTLPPDFLL